MTVEQIGARLRLIRRCLRIAAVVAVIAGAAGVAAASGRAHPEVLFCVAVLVAVVCGTCVSVEVVILLGDRTLAAMPPAEEMAARVVRHAREGEAAAGQVPRIGDYRR